MDTLYQIGSYGDLSNMAYAEVMDRARHCFGRTAAEKAALTTAEAVCAWQQRMRQAFLSAMGGLPDSTCDLDPVWAELRLRDGYSVQNVMFMAAPHVPVTATIWRPVGWDGPRPGVLFPCGHHEFPREVEEYQAVCATYAINGYVTLAFDPPGQGERKLCWDATLGRSFAGTGSAEHEHAGRQCELLGHNIARYFVRDGMRAFDLLASLPEVDEKRIAVTGNSGGGTQSSYLMLADDRLACGMPCTFTTDRQIYMGRTHWHDAEQNLDGAIAAGLDYDDFYAVFAPRPAAIGAVTWDFFPIEGTRAAYERVKRLYATLGVEERIALFEVEIGHTYHPELRRQGIEWFNRWLQPEAQFRPLEDFVPEPPESQRNTASGQVSVSVPGSFGVFEQNRAALPRTRQVPAPEELAQRLGLPGEHCPLNPRILVQSQQDGLSFEKSFIVTQRGHEADVMTVVPVLRIAPEGPRRAMIYCCDGGIASISPEREALLRAIARGGCAVYVVEPRGTGETKSRQLAPWDPGWLTETWLSQYLRMLGTSPGALRAYDLLRALEYVRAREGSLPVGLMAEGFMGWSAVLAAAIDRQVERICLDGVPSIEKFVTTWTLSPPEAYTIPGILEMGDVADFAAVSGAKLLSVDEAADSVTTNAKIAGFWMR